MPKKPSNVTDGHHKHDMQYMQVALKTKSKFGYSAENRSGLL